MNISNEQIKSFLKDSGLVSEEDISTAEKTAKANKETLGRTLIALGKLSEDDYRRIQALVLGVPYVDLKDQKIDFEVLSLIPEPVARSNSIVPYARKGGTLEVAMLDI